MHDAWAQSDSPVSMSRPIGPCQPGGLHPHLPTSGRGCPRHHEEPRPSFHVASEFRVRPLEPLNPLRRNSFSKDRAPLHPGGALDETGRGRLRRGRGTGESPYNRMPPSTRLGHDEAHEWHLQWVAKEDIRSIGSSEAQGGRPPTSCTSCGSCHEVGQPRGWWVRLG